MNHVTILGGGLAGCEAALYLAKQGIAVTLYEQKPVHFSPAHKMEGLAELVCSNSLKAERLDSGSGLLKAEMRLLQSSLLPAADKARVAAGGALAVDRDEFSALVTRLVEAEPRITLCRQPAEHIDEANGITLVATGPLTEGALAEEICRLTGRQALSFFDAAAPIVSAESLDMERVFAASRYGRGTADYLNCPFDKAGYEAFYEQLVDAERAQLSDADKLNVYEGCMPVEIMAKRGQDTLRYGPLRPVGLVNPATGHRPWANVQLRSENKENTLYNLVGFQTNLRWGEQKRVFSMIPGLEHAEFVRYGVMHRNSFLNSPGVLAADQSMKQHPNVFFAGQITGVEGYMESAMSGLLAAHQIVRRLSGFGPLALPETTMCGALLRHVTTENADYQPMGSNMGVLPPLDTRVRDKRLRYRLVALRAVRAMAAALAEQNEPANPLPAEWEEGYEEPAAADPATDTEA